MYLVKGQLVGAEAVRVHTIGFEELLQEDAERLEDHFIRLRRNGLPPSRERPKKEPEIPADELHRRHLEQIEREAFQKAFAAGEEAGLAMGEQKKQEEIARILPRFDSILRNLNRMPARIFAASEQYMVEVCITLLKEIFKHELTVNKESMVERVHRIMQQVGKRDKMEIHLAPEDAQFLLALPEYNQLQVVSDESVELGSVHLETEFGGVEDYLGVQLQDAERILREYLNGRLEDIGKGRFKAPPPEADVLEPDPEPDSPLNSAGADDSEATDKELETLPQDNVALESDPEFAGNEGMVGLDLSELDSEVDLADLELASGQGTHSSGGGDVAPELDDEQEADWVNSLLNSKSGAAKPPAPAPKPSAPALAAGGADGDAVAPDADDEEEADWVNSLLNSKGGATKPPAPEIAKGQEGLLKDGDGAGLTENSAAAELAVETPKGAPGKLPKAPPPGPRPVAADEEYEVAPLPDDEEEADWVGALLNSEKNSGNSSAARKPGGKSLPPMEADEDDLYAPGRVVSADRVTGVPAVTGLGLSKEEMDDLLSEPDDVLSDEDIAKLLAESGIGRAGGGRRSLSTPLKKSDSRMRRSLSRRDG